MNELDFYNQQFQKYKKYDHQRTDSGELNLEQAGDYFEYLVKLYSDPDGTLLDLGCGDGYFTSKLAEFNGAVIGVEPSNLINAANELLDEKKISNLKFVKEDAYKLPFDEKSIELVISRRGPDPENEVFRVLSNAGLFIFITIGELDALSLKEVVGRGQHFRGSEKVSDQLKAKFGKAGFAEIHCKEFLYDDDFSASDKLKEFLHQVPIIEDFSKSDYGSVDDYCERHKKDNITLDRHRVVLLARKST